MSKDSIYHGIVDIVGDAISLVEQHAGAEYSGAIKIIWNKRMRSTAGRAFLLEAKVELNPKLLELSPDINECLTQVRQTLLHELAHLLAHYRHGLGIQPHGREWQRACADLGIPGESATHHLNLPSRTQSKKWSYTCPQCLEIIHRVRRMKTHSACYPCCKKYNRGKFHTNFAFIEDSLTD